MLSLYLLYANTPKSTSAKAAPQWIGSPKGTGCTSEVAPTGDGRGELALKFRLPHNQRTYHNHANKTALNAQGHTTPQASSPPPSPNGPTSHPKGEAKLRTTKPVQKLKAALPWGIQKSMCKTKKPSPLGEGGRREPDGRGELASYLDCPTTNAPATTTQINRTKRVRPYNPASELPPHRALTGPPPTQRGRLKYSRKASANIQSNHYS